ncbi:MAG: HlyD family secretion protein [Planctomycetes bacterium]|nr:HlyD family secretion protein [Planctomycetota bacterium]
MSEPWPSVACDPRVLKGIEVSGRVRAIARVVFIVLAFSPILLLLVPWQQNILGEGQVVALSPTERQQLIEAPLDGRVVRWAVREAQRVKQGEPLIELNDNDPELIARLRDQRDAVRARADAIAREAAAHDANATALETARLLAVQAAEERVVMAQNRTLAAAQALEAAEGAALTARLHRDRQAALAEKGLASRRTVELAELDVVRARTEVERARATLEGARREEASLVAERDRAGVELEARAVAARASAEKARADLQAARAELARVEVPLARQGTQEVLAPRDGTVVRFFVAGGGELVKAGDPLLLFVPDAAERAVELVVKGNDAPLISEGRHVRIQFEGWPAVQFVGWPSVAIGTFGGTVAFVDATDDGAGKFRILVVPDEDEPWPEKRFLRQGVRAKGWVLLDQVTLGYELWRRINGFPQALQSSAPKTEDAPRTRRRPEGEKR